MFKVLEAQLGSRSSLESRAHAQNDQALNPFALAKALVALPRLPARILEKPATTTATD